MGVARLVEERNAILKKSNPYPRFPTTASPKTVGILGSSPTTSNTRPAATNSNNLPFSFKKLTSQEARERREKGLCFYCDEKFMLGHRCQKTQLYMIEDVPPDNS